MKLVNSMISILLVFVIAQNSNGQSPVIRKIPPQGSLINHPILKQEKEDSITTIRVGGAIKQRVYSDDYSEYFSLLQFTDILFDPDCHTCKSLYYTKNYKHEINSSSSSKNWKKNLTWRKIPKGTVYGKWEISTLPFPPSEDPGFSGIIRSGFIETQGADSVFFEINYIDDVNTINRNINQNKGAIFTKPKSMATGFESSKNEVTLKNLNAEILNLAGDFGARKFYIRIVPLNSNKQVIQKISNEVIVQEEVFKKIQPVKPQVYLSDDYTITSVKYVPVHFGDPNYFGCSVVCSYNSAAPADKSIASYANSLNDLQVMGLNAQNYEDYFKQLYPIGTVICPQPPKEKAWYEKAFNGVAGFITKSYDGAASFYNETKSYVKNKFIELNCNANLVTTVINPVSKLQEAAGPEVCEAISGAAFDYGMASVGIPPSMPTSDEFTKLAEGQIVELACDQLEAQTGLPVPEEARETIRKEFHEKVVAQTNKGVINCGFLNVKPDTRGQFQTAYLEIEITRTANTFKGKGVVGFDVVDNTTRTVQSYNSILKKSIPVNLNGNLFEHTTAQIPFLSKVGDKTVIYVILKPQESFVWKDNQSGVLTGIHLGPQVGDWSTPSTPTYEGYAHSLGFQTLIGSGSLTTFSLGLKTANYLKLSFNNP